MKIDNSWWWYENNKSVHVYYLIYYSKDIYTFRLTNEIISKRDEVYIRSYYKGYLINII